MGLFIYCALSVVSRMIFTTFYTFKLIISLFPIAVFCEVCLAAVGSVFGTVYIAVVLAGLPM